ncbi:uncharacterized protein LOC9649481 isoform X2 [Selaginella moellendorffii]|uniref:uncharacterized protein LOC9649481 isoform X2 n=1 Tax=Selaginella moellendorffii TaxID=88036 RepID=UPI000D1CCC4F|nr:uncharacterized protein LOC9649481 isoform X2 [Selaginella moellendorffii]|eukprot:XP_024514989.1 uncharacterized protein LOC9649481 isoform X2 [Selaginella moellendorffii]
MSCFPFKKISSSSKVGAMAASKMSCMAVLEAKILRFDCDEESRPKCFPSLSFVPAERREKRLESTVKPLFVPLFTLDDDSTQTVILALPSGASFYGTGEVSGPLERTGKRMYTWNTDSWGYGKNSPCLYQSHPWVFVVLPSGEVLGVLADTTRKCEVDLRKESTIRFAADCFYPVIVFGPYPAPEDLLVALANATGKLVYLVLGGADVMYYYKGTMNMPPKWALGYHQCRYSYEPASRVDEISRLFREHRIPADVVWMDIDYMNGFRCFTFDKEKFPDPIGLATTLRGRGFKAVWMIDPGIKKDEDYFIYNEGCSEDAWVVDASGKHFIGDVWPGPCVFPDYTQKKVRAWWSNLIKDFVSNGVNGIWNDMNEPAVFKSVSKTMPEDNMHSGDPEMGGTQNHRHYHNVYGMLMARATYEGMLLANPTKRPFVLTRAGFMGSQRYAATWTGDNSSNWDHAHMSIAMALNLSLSGSPLTGPDIGGFAGDATARLFGRWMGFGALFPFARGHSEKGTVDHEPWSFGDECKNVCRLALLRRYQLLPHLYTLVYFAHTKGLPVMAPIFFADCKDPKLRKVETSFLLGSLLVSTSTDPDKVVDPKTIVIPSGIWQRFDFDDYHPDLPLLHLRGGSIIPAGPRIEHLGEAHFEDPVTLIIALDKDGNAEGVLYEDDGESFGYQKGEFLLTHYEANSRSNGSEVLIKVAGVQGALKRPKRPLRVRLLIGDRAEINADGQDGDDLLMKLPGSEEMQKLVEAAVKQVEEKNVKGLAEYDITHDKLKGVGAPRVLIELSGTDFQLKVVPWIGGRIISMVHKETGIDFFPSRVEGGGYEEYSTSEHRGPGCTEEYNVLSRNLLEINGEDVLSMECDLGGGLVMSREIAIHKKSPKVVHITSQIVARSVGAGAGGYSRIACLRVQPSFQVPHPSETLVKFTAVNGAKKELGATFGETFLRGDDRPNGEWMLVDKESGYAVVNRFNVKEVSVCLVHWGGAECSLGLWSEERSLSKETPLQISHHYQIIKV